MGDLGGGKKDAAHFLGVRDIDYQVTRPTFQIGYRYRFHEYFVTRINYSYALISGKDAASGILTRTFQENLSFRSGVYELTRTSLNIILSKEERDFVKSSIWVPLKSLFPPVVRHTLFGGIWGD